MNIEIKQTPKNKNSYTVTMKGFTEGMVLALRNALVTHSAISAVGGDVLAFLDGALLGHGGTIAKTCLPPSAFDEPKE